MASPTLKNTNFAEATALKQLSSHTYSAFFQPDWCIGNVPHGGYVTSTFLQVAEAHFNGTLSSQNQPHTLSLHISFLNRTSTGPALFTVTDTKLGRQTSIIHISLTQPSSSYGSRPLVVSYITQTNLNTMTGASHDTNYTLTPPAPPSPKFITSPSNSKTDDPNWMFIPTIPFSTFRKACSKLNFWMPRQGQPMPSIGDEWMTLTTGEKFTTATLGFICDMFPMVVDQYENPDVYYESAREHDSTASSGGKKKTGSTNWYPTLLLNLEVKKPLPADGVEYLFLRVHSKVIKDGRMDLEMIIMDPGGEIVALSNHVTLVLDVNRNLAEKGQGGASKI